MCRPCLYASSYDEVQSHRKGYDSVLTEQHVFWQTHGQPSAGLRPTLGRPSANPQPTHGQTSADPWPNLGRPMANPRPTRGQPSTDP